MSDTTYGLAEKLALLSSLRAYDARIKNEGCAMYRPHPKQDKFHRLGGFKYRYARTGNRFGKSDMGSAEDIAWAIGERPWYDDSDPARHEGIPQRCTKGLILCTDWEKVDEVFTGESEGDTQGKLWRWLPKKNFVRRDTNHSGHINKLTISSKWGGESVILIDTIAGFKLNAQRGESNWYDWIHVDEPIPEAMWNSYARGLIDRNGKAWFTCTPIREPWINRFFLPTPRAVLSMSEPNVFPDKNTGKLDRVIIIGASTDNPYTSKEGIESFASTLSDREKAARLFGAPIEQSGAVHALFNDEHIYTSPPPGWSNINTPPLDYTIRYHIDCHHHTPHAVLFVATSPAGEIFFYDEIFEACTVDILADMIKNKVEGYFVAAELIDPSGFNETMASKTAFADDLRDLGLQVEKASKDLTRGILMTNQSLAKPGLLNFACNLQRTLFEFDTYCYQDPLKRPDKPIDKDDHMMEGLHRLVLNGLSYISPNIFDEVPVCGTMSLLTI